MTNESRRRMGLYGAGSLLAGALLFAGFGLTVAPDAATRLNGAVLLAQMGRHDEAIRICRLAIDEHEESVDARVCLATFLAESGRTDEALAAYAEAIEANRDDPSLELDLELDRASLLARSGRADEALRSRERLRSGGGIRADLLDAAVAGARKEWAVASAAYARAVAGRPEDQRIRGALFHASMEEGRAALAGGDAELAREAFDRAREAVPGEASGHLRAAEVRIALRRPLEAIEVLRDVRPGTPGVAALVFRAATALLEGGESEKALWALEGALGADPRGVSALLAAEPAWAARRDGPDVRAILSRSGTPGEGRVDRPGASDTVPHDAGTSAYDGSKTN